MAAFFYPDIEPYPTTYVSHTYAEPGHHLHHVPLPYMAHKLHTRFHDKDLDVHQARADVRETLKNFYLELELPGVKDKAQLHLRWTSMRTLLITSRTARPEIPEEELAEVPVIKPAQATEAKKEAAAAPPAAEAAHNEEPKVSTESPRKSSIFSHGTTKKEPHLTVHERQIGEILRAFNFPVDVDRDNTHARLDAGLLSVIIPKVEHEQIEHLHVPVRDSPPTGFIPAL